MSSAKKQNSGKRDEKVSMRKNADNNSDPELVKAAHDQADEDIARDPDLSIHSPNDDLDEEESARLGEDKTDLV